MSNAVATKPSAGEEETRQWLQSCARTLDVEIDGLNQLKQALGNGLSGPFCEAIEVIRALKGRLIVTGIGKSGHVAKKIAATLASTGTPAFFVHAGEASHGDLGMITPDDAVIALSWSGETQELASTIAYSRRFRVPLIAMTAGRESALAQAADIVLLVPRITEACPHGLAPTTSTILQMSLGDCLALALLEARGFSAADFKKFHPGGRLGASLQYVRDIMHVGGAVPTAPAGTLVREAIVLISQKGFGCVGILDTAGHLCGIITDGDLRRHLSADILASPVEEIMSASPKTVPPDMLVGAALEIINSSEITALYVVEDKKPVGIVHFHDLLRIGTA
ncbi:MAG: KpsF/GutQ family sugar-phosphate isomerase [Stappiaceae bacterium]